MTDTAPGPPALSVRRLTFGHAGRRLFDDWSADFAAGVNWVIGGDGSGKTSLLRLIAGEWPTPGAEFRVGGLPLAVSAGGRRPAVAWCDPQTGAPGGGLTNAFANAFANLTPLAWYDRLRAERPNIDGALLQRHLAGLGLTPHLAKPLYQLSTGSRRKVLIAGSLAANAPVTLLDQPFAALDDASRRYLLQSLADCASEPGQRVWLVADHQLPGGGATIAGVVQLPG